MQVTKPKLFHALSARSNYIQLHPQDRINDNVYLFCGDENGLHIPNGIAFLILPMNKNLFRFPRCAIDHSDYKAQPSVSPSDKYPQRGRAKLIETFQKNVSHGTSVVVESICDQAGTTNDQSQTV